MLVKEYKKYHARNIFLMKNCEKANIFNSQKIGLYMQK